MTTPLMFQYEHKKGNTVQAQDTIKPFTSLSN